MVKVAVQKKKSEAGQAVLLVISAMSVFLLGAVGLAIDGSHLYAQRQAAQAAADASAVAGIMSIFDGTNTFTSDYNCTTTDGTSPCSFARQNGFKTAAASTDTVSVEVDPAGVTVPKLDPGTPHLLRVTVTRPVSMTLTKFVGLSSFDVSASATAAIVDVVSPVPIIITHPTLAGALNMNGTTNITITGGPTESIQINSTNTGAYSPPSSDFVDLSGAGPKGTGANFGISGGPRASGGNPDHNVKLGSTGHYISPSSPILDPLAGIPAPAVPTTNGSSAACSTHCGSCPGGAKTCTEFTPGLYPSGISVKNDTAMFDPGIYYIQSGGFTTKNSTVGMCTSCTSDPTTKDGMLVYDTGPVSKGCDASGGFTIDTNSNDIFYGAGVSASSLTTAPVGPYYGILFFEDHSACAQTHTLGQGNGCFSIVGTIYITNTLSIMQSKPSQYQAIDYHGNPCSTTSNYGEIIASQLSIVGNSGINMGLLPNGFLNVRKVALVN